VLRVGQPSVKASSSLPETAHLIGLLLAKLTKKARQQLLSELPEAFAAAGNTLPEITPELLGGAKALLERLRAKKSSESAAPITLPGYQLLLPTS